jgi:hypothetical protein
MLVCGVLAEPVIAFVSHRTHRIAIPSLGHGAATATCPSGQHVAFGGFAAQFDLLHDRWVMPTGMRRTGGNRWTAYGQSASLEHGSHLTSVAYCGHARPAATKQKTVSVAGGHVGSAVAKCPAGTVVLAGGFTTRTFPYLQVVNDMERIAPDAWRVSVLNVIRDSTTTVTAIAYCGPGPAPQLATSTVDLASGAPGTVRATCPVGTQLVFGGEIATAPNLKSRVPQVLPFKLTAESNAVWSVAALNGGGARGTITALAYCR